MPEGGFKSIDDLGGILAVGTPEEVVEQVAELGRRGIDHYVFDLRMQYDRYEESVALIAEEILPALRAMKA